MRPASRSRAGLAVAGCLLSALAVTAGSGFVAAAIAGPAISDRRDQPTAADVPTKPEGGAAADRPVGNVAPPSAISTSTAVMDSDRKGKASRTNPLDHIPAKDRAATGGRGE